MKIRNTKRVSATANVSAPVGGLNARDSYAAMDAADAVKMDNWFPLTTSVRIRAGYSKWSTGLGTDVNTIMAYNAGTTKKLIAVAGTNFYDVTAGGAVGAAVTTCTNANWQHVNFATSGGFYLSCVNGVDAPKAFDGTTWTNPAITGVTPTELINVTVHMQRQWFIQKDTMKVWYLPINAIAGAATAIDFSSIFKRGGYLMAMGSWTIDSGAGMDDYAVFVTSEGEVATYRGVDPASALTWGLVGTYQIGSPMGRRCMSQYASDLLIITQDGLMPMSKALMSSRVSNKVSLTDKIQYIMSLDISTYSANTGWQCRLFPRENMLLMNVPAGNSANYQYAMNTITGAWCKFTGWDARCWEMYADDIYYGDGLGNVCKAWDTNADDSANINTDIIQAFNYLGTQNLKHFKLARPIFSTTSHAVSIVIGLNIDFNFNQPLSSATFPAAGTSGIWNTSKWNGCVWGSSTGNVKSAWNTSGGIGYCAGMHITTASNNATFSWQSTTHVFEKAIGF